MYEEIISKLSKLENVISEYNDVIEREADDYRKECGIISSEAMQDNLERLAEDNRLLNVGIIGRVKAGKSSLLNTIFFNGESILPKAATPMTASLTILTYGDTFSASVEYFTPQDIETIKNEHNVYKKEWDKKYKEKIKDVEERAKRNNEVPDLNIAKRLTDKDMKEKSSYASFDQYERMLKSDAAPNEIKQPINANSLSELLGQLNEFVGSDGKMMPYSKSVEILIPNDSLKDICVVDTPGINDPVKSREARTEDFLKNCDVVFIISPAGSFIDREDTCLMDKLAMKQGVRELYLIASQADNELYESVRIESNNELIKAITKINNDLYLQASDTLSNLKINNPEITGQFDQLINGGLDRVIITSAICHDMYINYDEREKWDESTNHVWGLLNENYPDYFNSDKSAKENLIRLSGIEKVKNKIELTRKEKDKIIAQKQADYINDQIKVIENFSQELLKAVKLKFERVKDTDIKKIETQKKNLEILISKCSEAIDGTLNDSVEEFKIAVRKVISDKSKILFIETENKISNVEKSETRSCIEEKTTGWWIFKKVIPITKYYDVRTLRTGIVKSSINNLFTDLQDTLINSIEEEKLEWKKEIQTKIIRSLREAIEDDNLIDIAMLKTALRRIVNKMELPNLDMGLNVFSSSFSGTIENHQIDYFMDEVETFKSNLKNTYIKVRDQFLTTMEKSAKSEKMSDLLFSNMKKDVDSLEKEIKNKELTMDRLKKCASMLEKID